MLKELKYGGYSASPNDHEAIEGDLAVAMNLIPENGTVRPVAPPRTIARIPGDPINQNDSGRRILCIHETSAFKHYIVAIDFDGLSPNHPPYTNLYLWDGTEGSDPERIGAKSFAKIYKVEPVGNTLVVLADDGIHYYLWKNDAYNYLGNHLPELDLSFSLIYYDIMASDQHEVDLGSKTSPASILTDKDLKAKLCQAILASANQVTAKAQAKKCFTYPFFVRYAFRLYDGSSVTMHSAPALMVPTMEAPEVLMGWTVSNGAQQHIEGPAKVSAKLNAYKLFHYALDSGQLDEVAHWEDIISSIDVYISPQFYTYDQAIKDDEINLFGTKVLPDKDITQGIRDNGTFFLIKSIKINDIFCGDGQQSTAYGVNRPSEGRPRANINANGLIIPDFEPNNDNIVVRDLMSDDYGTHDELIADKSFAYNRRINLAGVSKRLFNGFNPACMWAILDAGQTAKQTTATVVIDEGGREIVVARDNMNVYWNASNTVVWFFYPNSGAKRVYLNIGGSKVMIELTVHPTLNGAYYYGLAGDAVQPVAVDSIPTPSTDEQRLVSMPNKVYTSEVDNPFYFPSTGINSISSGNIMGICAAVRPVSTSQYGYADLYVFADNGIWTAKINDKGTYGNLDFATGDICINPDSITQMETSVLFTTDRGIMLISGSQAQCISETIDSDYPFSLADFGENRARTIKSLAGFSVEVDGLVHYSDIDPWPFKDFLAECRMIYDYTGQRIIAYNHASSYAYIYSLESNKWGMMQSEIDYGVKAYPDAMAVTRDGKLVNFSEPSQQSYHQMLVTRPLILELPDIHKTIRTILQRGQFRRQGRVRSVLFGSNDLLSPNERTVWQLIGSSNDENLRGISGTPYKYFRIVLLLDLADDESVTGCSIQLETKYTNRLR